jgi:phage tail-like protein
MHSRKLLAALVGAAILIAGALGAWASSPAGAAAAPDTSPLTAARFEVTIDGHSLAVFQELVGITSQVDGSGSELALVTKGDDTVLKLPGKRTPPTITLRRAMTRNIEMAAWHELVILGDVAAATKSVSITAYNKRGDPIARYHLTDAWPSRVEITAEDSAGGGVMSETVTLVSKFMQRVSV